MIAAILSGVLLVASFSNIVFATTVEEVVQYIEDFEGVDIQTEIQQRQNGWGWDAAEDQQDKADIWVGESGSSGNSLRFASKDWYKNMWVSVDLLQNGTYKRVTSGTAEDTARAEVTEYLGKDMRVSLNTKFEIQGSSDKPEDIHEQYFRFKGADSHVIVELVTYDGELCLIAPNKEKTKNQKYPIKTVNIAQSNTEWHTLAVEFDFETNSYKVIVDDEVFDKTPFGAWIPAGDGLGVDDAYTQTPIGNVQSVEVGYFWSGWWQCQYVDDIRIETIDAKNEGTPEETDPPTETDPPIEQGETLYAEDFEKPGLDDVIKAKQSGWGWDAAENQQDKVDIWRGASGSDGNSLRFASTDWFKNMWLTLDLKQNGIEKYIDLSGSAAQDAEVHVSNYLKNNMKLSWKMKFEIQGMETKPNNVHEQYIRIKGDDSHVVAELVAYNGELCLIALDDTLGANGKYPIKTVNVADKNNEWHDIAVYFNMEKDKFMIEVDGEIFKDTPHGSWIPTGSMAGLEDASVPTPIGSVQSIEFGHFWSGWWQSSYIDDMRISTYEMPEEEFGISNILIKNQYGNTDIAQGNTVTAEIVADGGIIDETKTVLEWFYSSDDGTTWTSFTDNIVPPQTNKIKVTATCTSTLGKESTYTKEKAVEPAGRVETEEIFNENFEKSGKQEEIRMQMNGWTIKGPSNQVDVGTGFGGTRNSLRFGSKTNSVSNNLSLNFLKRGAQYKPQDMLVLKFDVLFALDDGTFIFPASARAYARVKDTSGKAFAAISLVGDTLSLVYYNETTGKNESAVIASRSENILKISKSIEFYLDTAKNRYCVMVDGKLVGPDGNKWLIPSDSIVVGIGKPNTVTGFGSLDIGQENSAWWANTCIDNVSLNRCHLPEQSNFTVNGVNIRNEFESSQPIAWGSPVTAIPDADVDAKIPGQKYTWNACGSDGVWKEMTNNIVPQNTQKLKVDAVFTNQYGQQCTAESEIAVVENTIPKVSNVLITGTVKAGETLKATYTVEDSLISVGNNKVEWFQSKEIDGKYVKIGEGSDEYVIAEKNEENFIKVCVTPIDEYGAVGTSGESVLAYSTKAIFDAGWKRLKIDTAPAKGVTQLTLPQTDTLLNINCTYKSLNSKYLSDSGEITRPKSGYETVSLEVTATDKDGNTDKRTYRVLINSFNSDAGTGGGGSGGGGGGGSTGTSTSGTINVPKPAPTPMPTQTPDPEQTKPQTFADVADGQWYAQSVNKLYEKGIVSGDSDGNFRPQDTITRAEFVKMIVELLGIKDDTAEVSFSDVESSSWQYPYVASAVKFEIVYGKDDDSFGAEDNISRQDMAVIAMRAAKMAGITVDEEEADFDDKNEIESYALSSVSVMKSLGIIQGDGGLFRPKGNATRAEAAQIICRLMEVLETAK